jgi:hypothetical protein
MYGRMPTRDRNELNRQAAYNANLTPLQRIANRGREIEGLLYRIANDAPSRPRLEAELKEVLAKFNELKAGK